MKNPSKWNNCSVLTSNDNWIPFLVLAIIRQFTDNVRRWENQELVAGRNLSKNETSEKCILGVRSRDGRNFALDISRIQDANSDLKAEDTVAVTGTIKPEIEMQKIEWVDFDIAGVVLVNTLLRTR